MNQDQMEFTQDETPFDDFSDSELNLTMNAEIAKLKETILFSPLCNLRKKERVQGSPNGTKP